MADIREYGIRNEDGSVTIWETDGTNHWPTNRTESWEQNQGISAAAPASPYPQVDVGGYYTQQLQLQAAQSAANQAYLAERLRLLEIPEMEARTELDRHQLALQAAIALAEQTGWIQPGDVQAAGFLAGGISNSVGQQISGPGVMMYQTVNGLRTVQQMQDELYRASGGMAEWQGDIPADRIISEYGKVTGGQVTLVGAGAPSEAQGATYQTRNGVKTVSQMQTELRDAGSPNWNNPNPEQVARLYAEAFNQPVYSTGVDMNAVNQFLAANPDIKAWGEGQGWSGAEIVSRWNQYMGGGKDTSGRWEQTQAIMSGAASGGGVSTGHTNMGEANLGALPWNRTVPGAQQTMAGATVAAAPGRFENNLQMLGVNPSQVPTNVPEGAVPTLQLKEMMANPANMPASLMALGNTSQQVAQFLNSTPYVQGLTGGNPAATGESGFGFISGRHLPVRQTLADIQSNSQKIPLLQGLFAFSGQNPGEEFGEFSQYLPKGGANPLTRFV